MSLEWQLETFKPPSDFPPPSDSQHFVLCYAFFLLSTLLLRGSHYPAGLSWEVADGAEGAGWVQRIW